MRVLKQVCFTRSNEGDMELLSFLEQQGTVSTYIKALIRRDMEGLLAEQQEETNSELLTAVERITTNSNKNTDSIVTALGQLVGALQGSLITQTVTSETATDKDKEETKKELTIKDEFDFDAVGELLKTGGF